MADNGWEGAWEPVAVPSDVLEVIRDIVGEPVMGRNGRPLELATINLRDGSISYPARTGGR